MRSTFVFLLERLDNIQRRLLALWSQLVLFLERRGWLSRLRSIWVRIASLLGRVDWQGRRFPLLLALLLLSLVLHVLLIVTAPPVDKPADSFIWLWLLCFVPYLAACALVLSTKPPEGRGRWRELALLLGGALVLRALFVPLDPNLSHDSWRYLWDARVTLAGYSPYVYAPGNPILQPLWNVLYENSRFRDVPTIYPPAAQSFYLLGYLLGGGSLPVLKALFVLCDLLSCWLLIILLQRKGLDPAWSIIYAWCPLPIVEFAMQGHVDGLTILLSLCAIACAQSSRRGARVLTGLFIALATLVKLYPIILLLVVWRKRDWVLLLTCISTIILAYLPYLLLGSGSVLGFFGTYASEQTPNAGPVQLLGRWIGMQVGWGTQITVPLVYALDLLVMGSAALIVFRLRQREQISMEAATALLTGAIFAVSSHIFPWYTIALLPWVVLLIRPVRTSQRQVRADGIAVYLAWYFACIVLFSYFLHSRFGWEPYYFFAYDLVLLGLGGTFLLWRRQRTAQVKRETSVNLEKIHVKT